MRKLKIIKYFNPLKNTTPKVVTFDDNKYSVEYIKSPTYGTKSILTDSKTGHSEIFTGSVRYIGEGFFLNISTIKARLKDNIVIEEETGEILKLYTIIYLTSEKKFQKIDITRPCLKFVLSNYYNKISFEISNGYIQVHEIDINNKNMNLVLQKNIPKTANRYIEVFDLKMKKTRPVAELYGNILDKFGSLLNL